MGPSLADLSLTCAVALLTAREISPGELVQASLDRARATADLGAFVVLDEAGARRAAGRPQPGPLYGVPVAVKDVIDVAGLPTRGGSRATSDAPAARDAAAVAGLRSRGAIVIGKTATHELAYGVTTPSVHNPRHPGRTAGGSSGGSAVAVATGAAPLALGTDTAGSVRIPAACCAVAGLIGRAARVSRAGVLDLSPSFDTLGVLVRDAGDLGLAWRALSGDASVAGGIDGVVVAEPACLGRVDADDLAAAEAVAEVLGRPRRVADIPAFSDWGPPRAIVIADEALRAHRAAGLDQAGPALGAEIRDEHLRAAERSVDEVRSARAALDALAVRLRAAVGPGRVLVTPALPGPPPERTRPSAEVAGRLTRFVAPVNAAGLAAAVIPWGGRGVQLLARDERTLLAAVERVGARSSPAVRG